MKYLALSLTVLLNTFWITASAQQHAFQLATGIGAIGGQRHDGILFNIEPRVNLYQFSDKSSISIGSCIGMGPSFPEHRSQKYNEKKWLPYIGTLFNFPLTLNYTFGNGATPRAFKKLGYSVGVGYTIHNADRRVDKGPGIDTTSVHAHGLICDAKFNFPVGNSSWSLHASYMFNYSQHNPDVPSIKSISLQYTIGYRILNPETRRHYHHPWKYTREIRRRKKTEEKNGKERASSETKEAT